MTDHKLSQQVAWTAARLHWSVERRMNVGRLVADDDELPVDVITEIASVSDVYTKATGREAVITNVQADAGNLVAAADVQSGAMIALVPTDADLDRLVLERPGAELRDVLHLTLYYLGDAADQPAGAYDALVNAITDMVSRRELGPVPGRVFGANHWNPGPDAAWVLAVGDVPSEDLSSDGGTPVYDESEKLAVVRGMMAEAWQDGMVDLDLPEQHTPWVPHICLAYTDDTSLIDDVESKIGPVTFDRVRIAFAGNYTDVMLDSAPATVASTFVGGDAVPWHIKPDHADCPAGKPYAVVKDSDGSVAGCHPDQASADEQLKALHANEPDAHAEADDLEELGGDPNPGTKKDKRLKDNNKPKPRYETTEPLAETSPWEGVLVVEGVSTGDGREFATDALTWADPPLTLRWKKEDAHGGEHDVTVAVGRIDKVWRDANKIMGSGVIDLGQPDGAEAARRLGNQTLRGISIDADDITGADVEYVWPETETVDGGEEDADDLLMMLFAQPEKMIFKAGRIRAATLVDIPAFVEAYVALSPEDGAPSVDAVAAALASTGASLDTGLTGFVTAVGDTALVAGGSGRLTTFAVPAHACGTSDAPWDPGAEERNVPRLLELSRAHAAYGYVRPSEDGNVARADCRFLHHEVAPGGNVGPANLTAASSVIGVLHGARGDVDLTDIERRAVYEHVAQHLRDAGQEPEPFVETPALVAHAEPAWLPPASWFADPKLSVPTAITIDDRGRVYGHAAQWGQCHLGFGDSCVSVPRESSHPYFMTGEVVCADGSRVAVGQITVGTGHASLAANANRAKEHYDHTGHAVADVTIGNDAHGIWVAGSIRPTSEASRVHELRASGQVSGDWRRIGGQLRLVGLLAVNVPGFPVPRLRARVASGDAQALVAAGKPVVSRGMTPEEDMDKRALRLLRDQLTRRVHQEV